MDVAEVVRCDDDELPSLLLRAESIVLEHHERNLARHFVEENIVLVHDSKRALDHMPQRHEQAKGRVASLPAGQLTNIFAPIACKNFYLHVQEIVGVVERHVASEPLPRKVLLEVSLYDVTVLCSDLLVLL